ncbi:MAG TPA: 4-(cytidine 5'-diphospho)-2-C-methyl-D-erythritol kinase [Longimicrobiales bacterium]|nr:4-(cytidine 5'-diphospho)-2-C-methyl-D-erythritol kinase [Longimicrobiales bacterium]
MRERARAPAKVNLQLRIHDPEPSGFHRLESLFCALELADEITVEVDAAPAGGGGVKLDVEGPDLGPPEANLAVRAARGFLARAGVERAVAIRLRKTIPAGAGLGGGSSDAAAVLRALDALLPGLVPPLELAALARELGSDVPFFLRGDALAWGSGRGDVLAPAPPLPSAPVLLVFPPFPVSTAAAYRWLDEDRASAPAAGAGAPPSVSADWPPHSPRSWLAAAQRAANDFEAPVFRRHPELRALRDLLAEAEAVIAMLSGSGSALFGVFSDEDVLRGAIALLRARAPHVHLAPTRTASR